MWHKVSPFAFRLGYIRTWKTAAYADRKTYAKTASRDVSLRGTLNKEFKGQPIGNIFINYVSQDTINVIIYTSRVAQILGNNDENIERIKSLILIKYPGTTFIIDVKEVKKPELSSSIVADSIARQIEKKMPYRRVIKNAMAKTLEKWGLGIKVKLGGRINGAEIARRETYKEGSIPTQTIRSDIEFSYERAETASGTIGIKVWVYKGDIFKK